MKTPIKKILMSHIMECNKRSYPSFNTFYMYGTNFIIYIFNENEGLHLHLVYKQHTINHMKYQVIIMICE